MTWMGNKDYPDRFHTKSDYDDNRIPRSHRVYFPRFGENHISRKQTIYIKNYPRLEMDMRRLAVRLGTIDEQWIIRNMIHMLATIPIEDFNHIFEKYVSKRESKHKKAKQYQRKKALYSPLIRIANAGGLNWLIKCKAEGRTIKKTAEILDIEVAHIQYYLRSRHNTRWIDL